MAKRTIPVTVDGYGQFEIQLPKKYTRETVEETVMNAVLQTLNMMTEAKSSEKFHPAMGMKTRDEV